MLEGALAGRDWLERTFSLADIAFAPHFWMLAVGNPALDLDSTPNVRAWLDRLWNRPAWHQAVTVALSLDT